MTGAVVFVCVAVGAFGLGVLVGWIIGEERAHAAHERVQAEQRGRKAANG